MTKQKIVFFGPFVGEFGWELIYWQGWVRKLCCNEYKNYYKIASSFPGRAALYPYVDEFWALPDEFVIEPISCRGYIADNWINGLPKTDDPKAKLNEVYPRIEKILNDFKKKLPPDTIFLVPWKPLIDPHDRKNYGTFIKDEPRTNEDFRTVLIPYSNQILEKIKSTNKGNDVLKKNISPNQKLLVVFPRCRTTRRPDKNWSKEKYEKLISRIRYNFPEYKIALLGAPGGAYFTEGVPEGCLDLINLPAEIRMDVQLAALNQAVLAIGGESGGMIFALASGCPALCWGHVSYARNFCKENYMRTENYFYPQSKISVDEVMNILSWRLKKRKKPFWLTLKAILLIRSYLLFPTLIKNIFTLGMFLKRLRIK